MRRTVAGVIVRDRNAGATKAGFGPLLIFLAGLTAVGVGSVRAQTGGDGTKGLEPTRSTVGRIAPGVDEAARLEAIVRAGANTILAPEDAAGQVPEALQERVAALGLSLLVGSQPDSVGLLVARSPDGERFSVETVHLDPWPETLAGLDDLYASRARSSERTGSAPLALAGTRDEDAAWFLLPGPIEVTGAPRAGAPTHAASFRERHPAVAQGIHEPLQVEPFAFHRALRQSGGSVDRVIVVMGASGRVRINVAALFENDTVLRDVITGRIALVSFGQLAFTPDPSGLALFEEAR